MGKIGAAGGARRRARNHLRRHGGDRRGHRGLPAGGAGQRLRRRVSLPVRHDHLHGGRALAAGGDHAHADALLAVHDREGGRVALRPIRQPPVRRVRALLSPRAGTLPAASLARSCSARWRSSRSRCFSVPLLNKEFLPAQDIGVFLINFETPVGSSLAFTGEKARELEKILAAQPDIAHYFVNVGGFEGGETNKGISFVTLKDREPAHAKPDPGDGPRARRDQEGDAEGFQGVPDRSLRQFRRRQARHEHRAEPARARLRRAEGQASEAMTKKFAASGMMTDIDTDFRDGATEVQVEPDRDEAAASGVTRAGHRRHDQHGHRRRAPGQVHQRHPPLRRAHAARCPTQWQNPADIDKLLDPDRLRRTDPALRRDEGHRGQKAAQHHARDARAGDQHLRQRAHGRAARQGDGLRARDARQDSCRPAITSPTSARRRT